MKTNEESLFRRGPSLVVDALRDASKEWTISSLSMHVKICFPTVSGFVRHLEAAGITTVEKKGKYRIVKLTDKGREFGLRFSELNAMMKALPKPEKAVDPEELPKHIEV